MLWIKNLNCHKIGFYISSLVFVLGLFFSVFFATDTFATNYTTTFTQGSSSDINLCRTPGTSGDTPLCSDIKSIIINSTVSIRPSIGYNTGTDCSAINNYTIYFNNSHISDTFIISNLSGFCGFRFGSSYSFYNAPIGSIVTITLSTDEPFSSSNVPSGTLNISQNGTYDVSSYAIAEVDVPPIYGDYHDDLQQGITAIYVLGGVMLVIYFFYCIYRMIIKNVGGD